MQNEEEYTDYSCSTSVERLARDIETELRKWHVVNGSDRHVSFVATSTTASTTISTANCVGSGRLHTIRSSHVSWTVPLAATSGRVTINLTLALWDYPGIGTTLAPLSNSIQMQQQQQTSGVAQPLHANCVQHDEDLSESSDENRNVMDLPQSVRRTALVSLAADPFSNFSSLFGIGQHITLTPSTNQIAERTIMASLGESILERHADSDATTNISVAKVVVGSSLSSLLQMALNLAVANCQCRIPVFGVWGHYPSNQSTTNVSLSSPGTSLFPDWMHVCQTMQLPRLPKRRVKRQPLFRFGKKRHAAANMVPQQSTRQPPPHFNQQHVPNLFVGGVLSSSSSSTTSVATDVVDMPVTTFKFCAFPSIGSNIVAESRLSTWAFLLWQECRFPLQRPDDSNQEYNTDAIEDRVILCGARHVFPWLKPRKRPRSLLFANGTEQDVLQQWRMGTPIHQKSSLLEDESVENYREECRRYALSLMERACCRSSADDPLWGPPDDPVGSMYAVATWDHRSSIKLTNDDEIDANHSENVCKRRRQQSALLTFPLRIRSRQGMSPQDLKDVETAMEQSILDPLTTCSSFVVQVEYDLDTAVTTLAARLRCVLAALIRTATLPSETLLMHLTIEEVMDVWDNEAGNFVADKLAMKSRVGPTTRRLVTAMDWASVAEDMIEPWEAEAVVRNVLDGSLTLGFPSPPDDVFDPRREEEGAKLSSSPSDDNDPFVALPRSAPAGRLVSFLFAHLARVRAPSSMAMIWSAFVKAIRKKWDARESLPNMNYIPGIDPAPDVTCCTRRRWNYTIGLKADYSSFVHCSEPDPDDNYCLVGQKLQVFNLGVEGMITLGLQESERWEKLYQVEVEPPNVLDVSSNPTIPDESMADVATDAGVDGSPPKDRSFLVELHSSSTSGPHSEESVDNDFQRLGRDEDVMFNIRDHRKVDFATMDGVADWQDHSVGTMSKTLDYYDAFEVDSVTGSVPPAPGIADLAANVAQLQDRKGARCPVHGIFLVASGDQLFAPYLLRPEPLTDDLILERRQMLSRSIVNEKGNSTVNASSTVQHRLEVAQRLQKPKLLSDMCAFKAANPGAVFLDFTNWYGNPGNPLEDYSTNDQASVQPGSAMGKNVAEKLDKASEAIHILNATRDFWSNTWDEAIACPASEQKPLFDVCSTVEIALDYLETLHPASLLNQIMAVNLSAAYFIMITSAGESFKLNVVQKALNHLRETTTTALQLLSRDVTQGTCSMFTREKPVEANAGDLSPLYVSAEALNACEVSCNALADAETVIARCTSLLQKFPSQYDLVEMLMVSGQTEVTDPKARTAILQTIISLQQQPTDFAPVNPFSKPAMREYVFRNVDDSNPCQLSVRLGDESAMREGGDPGGSLLLALTKTHRE